MLYRILVIDFVLMPHAKKKKKEIVLADWQLLQQSKINVERVKRKNRGHLDYLVWLPEMPETTYLKRNYVTNQKKLRSTNKKKNRTHYCGIKSKWVYRSMCYQVSAECCFYCCLKSFGDPSTVHSPYNTKCSACYCLNKRGNHSTGCSLHSTQCCGYCHPKSFRKTRTMNLSPSF